MLKDCSWTFGQLESELAKHHAIDPAKRTAFQSRLKNFHRLGYPAGFETIKGKASNYSPLRIVEMALAVEMTQLGLPPDRTSTVLNSNRWSILMATELVARELYADPAAWNNQTGLSEQILSMFLYFDPAALRPLTVHHREDAVSDEQESANSFFIVGAGVVSEDIAAWTSGRSARLSMINLTAMTAGIAVSPYEEGSDDDWAYRRAFFRELELGAAKDRAD